MPSFKEDEMRNHSFSRQLLSFTVLICLCASFAFAHIRIYPTESNYGAREKYTMRGA